MTNFLELLKSRRSIRKYQPKAVEPEKISQILNAALMSPSSKRTNPWEFVVIQDQYTLQKLSESRPNGSQLLAGSPLGIVVIADATKSDIWQIDASIAAIIIQLQAQDLELASCWVQVYGRMKDENTSAGAYISQLLGIPSHYEVLSVISIGYSDEVKQPFEESKLSVNKIHSEKF